MKEYQRKQLLERIDREGATVGVTIPETVAVQGEDLALRAFVFESKRRDTYPPGERDRLERAKKRLRRERLERRRHIEEGEVDFAEGERLADAIIGISRALEALESLDAPSVEAEAKRQEAADQKRWVQFLRQALGRDEASTSRGRY